MIVEVCVDSVEGAEAAQQGGADRVELCAALLEGGLTPSAGTIARAVERLRIGIQVMVRPRGGDFLYSDAEFDVMARDVDAAKQAGAAGVVLGILDRDGVVDAERSWHLIARARPLSVTFHRAFDMARDPFEALETLVDLGVDRILTSGQEASAWDGVDLLRDLVRTAAGRLVIMPGGGIHERNIGRLVDATGAQEVHVTGTRLVESAMTFRNPHCMMGGSLHPPEYEVRATDPERIQELVRLARR